MNKFLKIPYFFYFLIYYLRKVIAANIILAADILTPKFRMSSAIVDVKLKSRNENYILAMSNLLSMTPGSLSLDYDDASNSLKVHILYMGEIESFYKSADELQEIVMKIF